MHRIAAVFLLALLLALQPAPPAQAQLAQSPWPMFRHDLKHTGRSPYTGPTIPILKWTFTTEASVNSSSAIGADGTLYVGSSAANLYALNPDGSLKWSFSTSGAVNSSPAIGADGTVYVGSYNGKLYALNPDGTLKWSFATGSVIVSSPAIGTDGTIYVGSYDHKLYAVNPNGSFKWSFATGNLVSSSPAIGADGTIYVGSEDNKLYAINSNGTLRWSFATGWFVTSSPALGANGTVYVGSADKKLYAVNPDGTLQWSFTTGDIVYSSPALGADGTVYVGSNDKKLYAVNPDGTLKWSFDTGIQFFNSSPTIGTDGTVYVGLQNFKLYAHNPDGTLKWSFTTGGAIQSSPAIGADGTMYVGSNDNKLYAIREAIRAASPTVKTTKDADGAAGVVVAIPQVYDANTLQPLPGVTIGSYQASLTYNGALLKVLDVRQKAPLSTGGETINNPGGSTTFDGSAPGGAPWPVDPLAFAALRLTGCANQTATLTPAFSQILDGNSVPLAIQQPAAKTYRRGDARADGTVNISDALFVAQYLAGLRSLGEDPLTQVNAVNAASVKQDTGVDLVTTADVLLIAQYVVGIRDACFVLIAPPPTPTPTATPIPTATATPVPAPTSTPIPAPPTVHSDIVNFTLQSLSLPVGATVIWHNHDSSTHTSTSGVSPNPNGFWNSGPLSQEGTFAHTFTAAGAYPYFCAIHTSMTATITITP